MHQATVKEAFMKKLHEEREKIVVHRNELSSMLKKRFLKPMDEVISLLQDLSGDVIVFQSPDRMCQRPESASEPHVAIVRRSSFSQVRHLPGSPSSRRSGLSAAEVKENRKASGQIRPLKIITPEVIPLTPLLEMSANTTADLSIAVAESHHMNVTFSPLSVDFSPKIASTERKSKRSVRTEKHASERLSIYDFSPATPRPSICGDPDTTLQADYQNDLHDTTLSAAHQNTSLLQQSFMDHSSFKERFGNGVVGRSTEISDSSIDDTPPAPMKNFRTIQSSCFGDLTDSPGTSAHDLTLDLSQDLTIAGAGIQSPEPDSEPEVPVKGKGAKRKTPAVRGGSKAKKSPPKKSRSQSAAKSLSSTNSGNGSTFNSTAVIDVTAAADQNSSLNDRPRRMRNEVSYKEPPLAGKLRRNF